MLDREMVPAFVVLFAALALPDSSLAESELCSFSSSVSERTLNPEWTYVYDQSTPLSSLSEQIGCDAKVPNDPPVFDLNGRKVGVLVGLLESPADTRSKALGDETSPAWVVRDRDDETQYTFPANSLSLKNDGSAWSAFVDSVDANSISLNELDAILASSELELARDRYLAVSLMKGLGSTKIQVTFESEPDEASVYINNKFERRTRFGKIMEDFDVSEVTLKLEGFDDCAGSELQVNDKLYGFIVVRCDFSGSK